MKVELAVVTADGARCEEVEVPAGATVADALATSRLADDANAGRGESLSVAVHGAVVSLGRVLEEGERIDVLRPLLVSPMEARRRRAR